MKRNIIHVLVITVFYWSAIVRTKGDSVRNQTSKEVLMRCCTVTLCSYTMKTPSTSFRLSIYSLHRIMSSNLLPKIVKKKDDDLGDGDDDEFAADMDASMCVGEGAVYFEDRVYRVHDWLDRTYVPSYWIDCLNPCCLPY